MASREATAPEAGEAVRTRRGTSNKNDRGNTTDRRNRRKWLAETYASDVPGHCRCYRCGVLLTQETLTVDRIIPGALGGTYVRNNIRPCCGACNSLTAPTAKAARQAQAASTPSVELAEKGDC